MAKAKVKTVAKAATSNGSVQLPEGYTAIVGDRGEKWDYEAHPVLEGVVEYVRTVEVGTGRNKREARIMSVRTADGRLFDVWESAALSEFFNQADEGTEVAIAFRGYVDVGRTQPMKDFIAGVKGAPKSAHKSARKPA